MMALSSTTKRHDGSSATLGPRPPVFIACGMILCCLLPVASAFSPTIFTRIPRSFQTFDQKGRKQSHVLRSSNNDDNEEGSKQPHIVIVGGGFGGVNTALTLPTLPWLDNNGESMKPKITLIDKSERFVFLPLLYELCVEDASLDEVAPTYKSLLDGASGISGFASGLPDLAGAFQLFSGEQKEEEESDDGCEVSFLQAQVEGIDVQKQQVVLSKSADGSIETIDYDALVIATGSEISLDAIPGASEYALPFYTVEQALELKRRLALLDTYLEDNTTDQKQPVNVVVVGGGYSGVELALNLVDRSGAYDNVEVSLVHRGEQILQYATEHNRNTGLDRLKSAGVNVMTSTGVVEVLPSYEAGSHGSTLKKHQCVVKLSTKSNDDNTSEEKETSLLPTTLLLWTAGATPTSDRNTGIRNSILPRDRMGRILTSSKLNVPEYPNVFAIGDCSRSKKVPYPGTAQVAIQQATVAAYNVYETLTSENASNRKGGNVKKESKLLPFKFLNLGEMMTLGTDDATISSLGGRVELSGPAASWLRRWIYAVRMPTAKQGVRAAVDGTGRKLARGKVGSGRRKSKPVDWK
mmetsp:Transcript_8583/g.15159  ORF Transcript_8583/g.15159 Transcript_8583/m.15159 type:complete len:580 (+) Transcript_8583:67-1806(+)